MIKIRVFNSKTPSELKELELKPEATLNNQCLIGRSQNCHLVLNDDAISRMHGKIRKMETIILLTSAVKLAPGLTPKMLK
jgi:predicted component of type VI protein secretion system